jgi:hypothetical protein
MFLILFQIVAVNRRLTSNRPSSYERIGALFGPGCCSGLYLILHAWECRGGACKGGNGLAKQESARVEEIN